MTALAIFGFLVLVALAVCITGAAIGICISEAGLQNHVSTGGFFLAIAALLWIIVFWISPFHVSIGVLK